MYYMNMDLHGGVCMEKLCIGKGCIEKVCGESTCEKEVSLMEMLDAREKRCMLQQHLLNTCQTPLICLTLNIPGPVKVLPSVPKTFDTACSRIRAALKASAVRILHTEIIKEKTGYEAFFSADASPELLKELMIPLEDQDRLGRLFDIDVLRLDGQKVSREELSHAPRRCLLCSEPAHVCSRSRRHSVPELTAEINRILADTAGSTASDCNTDEERI